MNYGPHGSGGTWVFTISISAPQYCNTGSRRGSSQFLVERSEWQHSSPGKLKVGGIVDGKVQVICEVQCIRPSEGVCLLVSGDVQQSKISERGTAESRIDPLPADGHCQAIGDLESQIAGTTAPSSAMASNTRWMALVASSP